MAVLAISLSPLHRLVKEALGSIPKLKANKQTAETFRDTAETLLQDLSVKFSDLMEKPLAVPESLAETAQIRFIAAADIEARLKKEDPKGRLQAALGINDTQNSTFSALATHWIVLDAVQEMLRQAGELKTNLLDDWLMVEPLSALYETTTLCSIEGKELPELLACLLTTQAPAPPAKTAEKQNSLEGLKKKNSSWPN